MAGLIPHLIAGGVLYLAGSLYYRAYFASGQKTKRKLLLLFLCVFFSVVPDFFLGTYYTTHILSFDTLKPYQVFSHYVLIPVGILVFGLLALRFDTKRKPFWIMGLWALVLHFLMDLLLKETGWFF